MAQDPSVSIRPNHRNYRATRTGKKDGHKLNRHRDSHGRARGGDRHELAGRDSATAHKHRAAAVGRSSRPSNNNQVLARGRRFRRRRVSPARCRRHIASRWNKLTIQPECFSGIVLGTTHQSARPRAETYHRQRVSRQDRCGRTRKRARHTARGDGHGTTLLQRWSRHIRQRKARGQPRSPTRRHDPTAFALIRRLGNQPSIGTTSTRGVRSTVSEPPKACHAPPTG